MDGLHKLVEMLERRFGKVWADILLVIVVLGAAAWAINSFVTYLLLPVIKYAVAAYSYVSGVNVTIPGNLYEIVSWATAVLAVAGTLIAAVNYRDAKRIWRSTDVLFTDAGELIAKQNEIITQYEKREAEHLKTIERLKKQNAGRKRS